ncbi:MAG: hypothetical protein SGI74_03660 [Oligoflexia bacterium]|nr:hypothetical protein [Oligoflexia bacterium]
MELFKEVNRINKSTIELVDELCQQLEFLRDLLAVKGIKVKAYTSEAKTTFLNLPDDVQRRISKGIFDYISIVYNLPDSMNSDITKTTLA